MGPEEIVIARLLSSLLIVAALRKKTGDLTEEQRDKLIADAEAKSDSLLQELDNL